MLIFLNNYDLRIQFLRSQGDQLLQSIRSLEIGMNRRRQQYQQPHQYEIDWMLSMARNLLQMLAEIKACEYFKMTQRLVFFDDHLFKETCIAIFRDLVRKFNARMDAKRRNRIDFLVNR